MSTTDDAVPGDQPPKRKRGRPKSKAPKKSKKKLGRQGDGGGRKRTPEQREEGLRAMESALIEGGEVGEIIAAAAQQWGISKRQAEHDLEEIRTRWWKAGTEVREKKHALASLNLAIRRRNALYKAAMNAGEINNALAVERDRCQLEDLYPPGKIAHTDPTGEQPGVMKHEHEHDHRVQPAILERIRGYDELFRGMENAVVAEGASSGDGAGEQVHSPHANGEAGRLPPPA